jgi:tRNA-Thr(GGU) m(6)t(6)A37 methyltransferase TsaA
MKLKQIGIVRKTEKAAALQIEPEYWDATLNVDKFSHLIVLWWIDGRDNEEGRSTLVVTPRPAGGDLSARSGVFACRSPSRPNPIGHSVVAVIEVNDDENRIAIDRIDARDGTPILDIKPYMPSSDRVGNAAVPTWFEDLEFRYD